MSEFRNEILIVEDDATLLKAMAEFFTRSGFVVHATAKTQDAKEFLDKKQVGTLFVDCLMPEQSGVEFVESIRKKYPADLLEVVLMSGVFIDSGFVKESLRTTSAKHFLKKPFQLTELLNFVDRPVSETAADKEQSGPMNRRLLYSVYAKGPITAREKRKVIESLETVHGFDLPFIFNLLVETKTSGYLNIVNAKSEVSGVAFAEGQIVQVDIPDKATYLGRLLLESGYVTPENLHIAESNKAKIRFGDKLIMNYSASPHAILLALEDQLSLRLSKTILDQNFKISFSESNVGERVPATMSEAFFVYLHDWISAKISFEWLKAHYTSYADSTFLQCANYNPEHTALRAPLVAALPGLVEEFLSKKSLGQILETQKYAEEHLLKALHYLLVRGLFALTEPMTSSNLEDRKKMLKKMRAQFAGTNPVDAFELMAQIVSGDTANPDRVLKDFQKLLGQPFVSKDTEMVQNYEFLVKASQEAFELMKSGDRDKIKDQIGKVDAERKMKAASAMSDAHAHLLRAGFKQALEVLKNVREWDPKAEHLRLYWCWARVGLAENQPVATRMTAVKEIEMDMLQIPPEEKIEAAYNFVQGLLAKIRNENGNARKYFEKAIAMDGNMNVARRELGLLDSQVVEEKTGMFGIMFKKKVG